MNTLIYWSPFIGNVGTIKSCINSAISFKKFSKEKNCVKIINVHGEWNNYLNILKENKIEVVNFYPSLVNYLPKSGYFKSRIVFILLFFISFIPLLKLLKKEKNCFFIAHLITSLPLFLNLLFRFNCKMILRISGYPKLNFIRKFFWSVVNKKVFLITCPTQELMQKLINSNFLENSKIKFLPDAILNIKEFQLQKNISKNLLFDKKIILTAGRLTKQKNHEYLIRELKDFLIKNTEYNLIILGEGEERQNLERIIKKLNLSKSIILKGFKENPFSYMVKSDVFILSSKWEEVGFVIVEAALSNLLVISSNCPNGPTEFLKNGNAGLLYENNKKDSLKNLLYRINDNNLIRKISAKKNSLKYTRFRHYLIFKKLLNL